MVTRISAVLRKAAQGRIAMEVGPVVDAAPMQLDTARSPAAAEPTSGWREDDVRAALSWICDRLAEVSHDDSDRAQPWELDLTVPGTTRILNRYAAWAGNWMQEWRPGGEGSKWPDWAGIVMMAAARAMPRLFEGRLISYWQQWRTPAAPSETSSAS